MENFTYTDIFETKGIEYIVIIGFLLLLIPFWLAINNRKAIVDSMKSVINVLNDSALRIQQGIFYSKAHTWAFLEKSGLAKIGIDDLIMKLLGNIELEYHLKSGQLVKKGDVIATFRQGKKTLTIKAPISGEVASLNQDLIHSPDILQDSPYDDGWLLAIRPSNWQVETQTFILGNKASSWFHEELLRFKDFVMESIKKHAGSSSLLAFQEGGELKMHPLNDLDSNTWNDFQNAFLE